MSDSYPGPERRTNGGSSVTRDEWESWCVGLGRRFDDQDRELKKVTTAMFAKDSDNEFGSPGVMTTMQRANQHFDTMCKAAEWVRRIAKWAAALISLVVAGIGLAKGMGWM